MNIQLIKSQLKNSQTIIIVDVIVISFVYCLMLTLLYLDNASLSLPQLIIPTLHLAFFNFFLFEIFGVYRSIWRYADIHDFAFCFGASICSGVIFSILHQILAHKIEFSDNLLAVTVGAIVLVAYRYIYYYFSMIRRKQISQINQKDRKIPRVLIVGGGHATASLLRELRNSEKRDVFPACIVDDDIEKQGKKINCVPIKGMIDDIPELCIAEKIEMIYICIPSASAELRRRILALCAKTPCPTKVMPSYISKMVRPIDINGHMRSIRLEDLLNRSVNIESLPEIRSFIEDKVIMVTGGGGSIGSEICRQVVRYNPKKLIILDNYENDAYALQQELLRNNVDPDCFTMEIASVRDKVKMDYLFSYFRPDYVFHAAAHKHVPLMEHNPEEAIKNNVEGTYITANMAEKYGVKRFVMISTDKAVRPSSFMGASKRLCELVIQSKNDSVTQFVAVRFGNVLGSNGSVVPLFEKQIADGGPVTVTHKDITRYFMTIPEAVNLVLQAGSMAKGGEIFVLNMGAPVSILTLAENMIKINGLVPYEDIDIKFTGLRPGEKLYEELLLDEEEIKNTENERIFRANQKVYSREEIDTMLASLYKAMETRDRNLIFEEMGKIIPNFKLNHNTVAKDEK